MLRLPAFTFSDPDRHCYLPELAASLARLALPGRTHIFRLGPQEHHTARANGFSVHAGVAAMARERDKRERLCRYITRPAVSEQRLSLTRSGRVRYQLKTCRSCGGTG